VLLTRRTRIILQRSESSLITIDICFDTMTAEAEGMPPCGEKDLAWVYEVKHVYCMGIIHNRPAQIDDPRTRSNHGRFSL
jgi:hypothetical protein